MSTSPSFERFDYLLRTNKHIERKLIFDLLHTASQKFDFGAHWYMGFGSIWFGDFRLAHRRLGIDKMVSIERSEYAPRADFNRPFAGIHILPGDCSAVMKDMGSEYWDSPVIAWLDYDGRLGPDTVEDIGLLLGRVQHNSVVIVTVNAARRTYRGKRVNDAPIARADTAVGVVEGFLGSNCIPTRYDPKPNSVGSYVNDVSEDAFPEFLAEAISTHMEHRVVASGREVNRDRLKFVQLYRLHHRDGADMVTVGGAITTEADEPTWRACLMKYSVLADNSTESATHCKLDLVPVTVKEKIVLDECLPDAGGVASFLAAAKAAGIALPDDEVEKYQKFYRHFPVFVESAI